MEGGTEGPLQSHASSFAGVIAVIMVIDFVFALDSIITAVGLSQFLPVMIAANVAAILVMLLAARPVGKFIEQHPTIKMLALAFILLIGLALVAEGIHVHIPRGFIYFAIAFSLTVETLNILVHRRQKKRPAAALPLANVPARQKKRKPRVSYRSTSRAPRRHREIEPGENQRQSRGLCRTVAFAEHRPRDRPADRHSSAP